MDLVPSIQLGGNERHFTGGERVGTGCMHVARPACPSPLPRARRLSCELGVDLLQGRKADKATGKCVFKPQWQQAGPLNHLADKVEPDQFVVNNRVSLSAGG